VEAGQNRWLIGGLQRSGHAVVDLDVEDREALAVGGVGVPDALDHAVGTGTGTSFGRWCGWCPVDGWLRHGALVGGAGDGEQVQA
jgi:hypothetical protein